MYKKVLFLALTSAVFISEESMALGLAQQHISRADCHNNESISYSIIGLGFLAKVDSQHILMDNGSHHKITSSPQHVWRWRHAAIHVGESAAIDGDWYTIGTHCAYNASAGRMGLWISEADYCIGSTELVY
jgi:hypothetical protein